MGLNGGSAWPGKLTPVCSADCRIVKRGDEMPKRFGAVWKCILREKNQNVGVRCGERRRLARAAVAEFVSSNLNDPESRFARKVRGAVGRRRINDDNLVGDKALAYDAAEKLFPYRSRVQSRDDKYNVHKKNR